MDAHSTKKQLIRQMRPYMLMIALSAVAIVSVLSMYKMSDIIL